MFNPLKTSLRLKIIAGIILALLVSFFFIQPKQNDIPTTPLILEVKINQSPNNVLTMKDISIINGYASDYQTDLQRNFYSIELFNGKKKLFTGKTMKKELIINEWLYENPKSEVSEQNLGDFMLDLPYYKEATKLVITEDNGKEVLSEDLTSQNLSEPKLQNSCGDGVCTDNENLLMCYSDCKHLLPKWLPK